MEQQVLGHPYPDDHIHSYPYYSPYYYYDWYYNRTDNTVYFTVVPTGNQLVEIAYPYAPRIIDPAPELPFN